LMRYNVLGDVVGSGQFGQDVIGPGKGHGRKRSLGDFNEVNVGRLGVHHGEAGAHFAVGATETDALVVPGVRAEQFVAVGPATGGAGRGARDVRGLGGGAAPRVVIHPDVVGGEDGVTARPRATKTRGALVVIGHRETGGD